MLIVTFRVDPSLEERRQVGSHWYLFGEPTTLTQKGTQGKPIPLFAFPPNS